MQKENGAVLVHWHFSPIFWQSFSILFMWFNFLKLISLIVEMEISDWQKIISLNEKVVT